MKLGLSYSYQLFELSEVELTVFHFTSLAAIRTAIRTAIRAALGLWDNLSLHLLSFAKESYLP